MSGIPKAELVLSEAGREQLMALTIRRNTAQALASRARIVLSRAECIDNNTVAAKPRVTHSGENVLLVQKMALGGRRST
ncbi:hypothetical protein [Paraburkholderia nodosa]|uniref:hypothetical protein n=1 Tax=Paraburkholderia nodosa TaxID=392320 RepID=UPI000841512F